MPISGLVANGFTNALDDVNERRLQEVLRRMQEQHQQEQLALQKRQIEGVEQDRATNRENQRRTLDLNELKRTDELGREATQRNAASDMANVLKMPGMSNEDKASEIMGSGLRTGSVDPSKVIEGLTRVPEKAKSVQYTYTDPKTGNKSLRFADPSAINATGLDMGNEPQKPERGPAPDYEWVIGANGQPRQIRKGSAQAGDRPYEKPAANPNAPDPVKAADIQQRILDTAKKLKTSPGLSSLTGSRLGNRAYGFGMTEDPIPGTKAANAKALFDTLKSVMTLENLGMLKGAMSDKDLMFLKSAGSSLETSMDDPSFLGELDNIIQKVEGHMSGTPMQPSSSHAPTAGGDEIDAMIERLRKPKG